jgi:hypothetical protein
MSEKSDSSSSSSSSNNNSNTSGNDMNDSTDENADAAAKAAIEGDDRTIVTTFDQAGRSLVEEEDRLRMEQMGDFDLNPDVSRKK